MGKPRKSTGKKSINGTRSIAPEVFNDSEASNRLSFKKAQYKSVGNDNKTRNRSIDKSRGPAKVVKKQKKPRVYTEKELGIPKLNTALKPVGVKVKGKKGKKFVDSDDAQMQVILAEVQQHAREEVASKLERARQIETIREQKRKEIEERERQQQDKLESKKKEVKGRKGSKGDEKKSRISSAAATAAAASTITSSDSSSKSRKRSVRFA